MLVVIIVTKNHVCRLVKTDASLEKVHSRLNNFWRQNVDNPASFGSSSQFHWEKKKDKSFLVPQDEATMVPGIYENALKYFLHIKLEQY